MSIAVRGTATATAANITYPSSARLGDVAVVYAWRTNSGTAPVLASGYTDIPTAAGASSFGLRIGYKRLDVADIAGGATTFTNAVFASMVVYSGVDPTAPIGTTPITQSAGTDTTIEVSGVTLVDTSGKSWVVGGWGDRDASAFTTSSILPNRLLYGPGANSERFVQADTNGGVSSDYAGETITATAGAGGLSPASWRAGTFELKGTPVGYPKIVQYKRHAPTSATTATVTMDASFTAGNLIVITALTNGFSPSVSAHPLGLTADVTFGATSSVRQYGTVATGSESTTINFTVGTTGALTLAVMEVEPGAGLVWASSPFDTSATTSGTGVTTLTFGAGITPSASYGFAVMGLTASAGMGTLTAPSNEFINHGSDTRGITWVKPLPDASAVTATATWTTSRNANAVLAVYKQQTASTRVTQTIATTWAVRQRVQQTRATTWAVKARVQQTRATTWAVKTRISPATRATTWAVRARVSQTRATTWSVKARAVATRATTWNVAARVSQTRATTWAVKTRVSQTRATTWAVRQRILSTRATTWDVVGRITATRATTWAVRQRVAATRATTWAVTQRVLSTRGTVWDVRQRVSATRATTWAVAARVLQTRATTWSVRARVSTTRATTWGVLVRVSQTRATTWAVRARTGDDRDTVWAVRLRVTKTASTTWGWSDKPTSERGTEWSVAQRVVSTRATTWNARSRLLKTSSTTWAVKQRVQQARATTWSVATRIAKTAATTWSVAGRVSATRNTIWALRARVTAVRPTTWLVATKVVKTQMTTWAVRQRVAQTHATTWSSLARLVKTINTTWTVEADLGPPTDITVISLIEYPRVVTIVESARAVGIIEYPRAVILAEEPQ